VLLLWLTILVLIPFDLATVDSSLDGASQSTPHDVPPVVARLVALCYSYLADPGIVRDMAAATLAKLLTRPDMGQALQAFLEWSATAMATPPPRGTFLVPGAASALAGLLKHGVRTSLAPAAPALWRRCASLAGAADVLRSPLLRRLAVKLATRVGLLLLRPRLVSWRYQRGARSLHANLGEVLAPATPHAQQTPDQTVEAPDDGDDDVPEEMEAIFELLLSSLKDTDTVVRWAAAKGVGRLTSRLARPLAHDVVQSVLETCQPHAGDSAWHGACLALAELSRRGTLLPAHLPAVVPVVIAALQYDVRRGPHSVGAHVRDAACYVVWAAARAYEPAVLGPHAQALAPHLLALACTDREVNCRRAAAAAFQECVGRLGGGQLAGGITAVQRCDYFSVGTRTGAYLTVTPAIGALDAAYLGAVMQQLVLHKAQHWDKHLRSLTATALAALVPLDPAAMVRYAATTLLPRVMHADPGTRHGALCALAAVICPLMDIHRQRSDASLVDDALQGAVAGAVPALEKARLYRGKGGELVRVGACTLLAAVARARLPVDAKLSGQLLTSAHESVSHPYAEVQAAAALAIGALVAAFGDADSKAAAAARYARMLQEDDNPAARRGAALALASLPHNALGPSWPAVVAACLAASTPEADPQQRDAETRVNAVRAMGALVAACAPGTEGGMPRKAVCDQVVPALLAALQDYCTDSRGDVGSWVREASMGCLPPVLCAAVSAADANLVTAAVCALLKQAAEKIDRTRGVAAASLAALLRDLPRDVAAQVPHYDALHSTFAVGGDATHEAVAVRFATPATAFPALCSLLPLPEYREALMGGLFVSVGGITNSLATCASNALATVLNASGGVHAQQLARLAIADVLAAAEAAPRVDRVVLPALRTIDKLYGLSSVAAHADDPAAVAAFHARVMATCVREARGCRDVAKLCAMAPLLAHLSDVALTQGCDVRRTALWALCSLMAGPYPRVRRAAAEELYMHTLGGGSPSAGGDVAALSEVEDVLVTARWDGTQAEVEATVRRLCGALQLGDPPQDLASGLLGPAQVARVKAGAPDARVDEHSNYASLVDDAGY
jgi:hypothetical protein